MQVARLARPQVVVVVQLANLARDLTDLPALQAVLAVQNGPAIIRGGTIVRWFL